jgi:hypothetical protein
VRRRGGGGSARRWPALWFEGAVHEYVIGRDPFPPVGTPRRKLVLFAEERQVVVPARAAASLPAGARRMWANGLGAVVGVDAASLHGLLAEDERAFAVNRIRCTKDVFSD